MVRKKFLVGAAVFVVVIALLGGSFFVGYQAGKKVPEIISVQGISNLDAGKPDVNFGIFWEAWKLVNDQYLRNKDVKDQDKVYGAVSGLVGSLKDPYSQFLPPSDSKKFQEDVQGNFGGIGAELGIKKDALVVIAPLKDTPASKVGLLAGDQIVKINATSTEGMMIEEAVRLIRGPVGTEVGLTIFREGWEKPKDLTITRATIMIPTLDAKTISTPAGNITHLELHSFNSNASFLFHREMSKAIAAGSKGLVLDLRNDPGGFLQVAVDLAGWFVPRGSLVVSEKGRNDEGQDFRTVGNEALLHFPVVVLINKGSASASEILAGALRDIQKIKLVGETSFGKGSVQQLQDLSDGSSIKITVAHWVLPSGRILDSDGLEPDVKVEMTDEDIENKRDPQLDKAVEVLQSQIAK
ncbi:MAG: S41 family peptidase [Candidatus Liptonbacteria bacterium]|nr:S41 family peptidase [Candidatus Liptonbacteria bacterium]